MKRLIENLKSFNSKERFFLIGHTLGNVNFALSKEFKQSIQKALGLKIPKDVFAAMDYHLDWIYASLYLTFNEKCKVGIYRNKNRLIKAQQEDIDFIIAFIKSRACHIVLIEAKGVTGWTNKQMRSKAKRLSEIFGEDGDKWPGVKPHFLLLSRRKSKNLNVSKWPVWMKVGGQVPWSKLPIPSGLRKVTRCNSKGKPDINGRLWKVDYRTK